MFKHSGSSAAYAAHYLQLAMLPSLCLQLTSLEFLQLAAGHCHSGCRYRPSAGLGVQRDCTGGLTWQDRDYLGSHSQ